jgi:hypothetical protein
MPTTRRRRTRERTGAGGLSEVAFLYFGSGPFFEAEDFEEQTTEAERKAIWLRHREAIIARWHRENPAQHDRVTWGERLEAREGTSNADE